MAPCDLPAAACDDGEHDFLTHADSCVHAMSDLTELMPGVRDLGGTIEAARRS